MSHIVVDPTVEKLRPLAWWESWYPGWALDFFDELAEKLDKEDLQRSMIWRCLHCDAPVNRPGETCRCQTESKRRRKGLRISTH